MAGFLQVCPSLSHDSQGGRLPKVLIGVVKDRERNLERASTYGDFDGDFGVHTVLVVKIDAIHVQSLQAGLTSGPHILRVASH